MDWRKVGLFSYQTQIDHSLFLPSVFCRPNNQEATEGIGHWSAMLCAWRFYQTLLLHVFEIIKVGTKFSTSIMCLFPPSIYTWRLPSDQTFGLFQWRKRVGSTARGFSKQEWWNQANIFCRMERPYTSYDDETMGWGRNKTSTSSILVASRILSHHG